MTSSALIIPAESLTAYQLCDFILLRRVGAGSFGEVFKALHRTRGTLHAIKTCRADVGDSAEEISRWSVTSLREVSLLSRLATSHIPPVQATFCLRRSVAFVMPFYESDLTGLISAGVELPVSSVRSIARAVISALSHAHTPPPSHVDPQQRFVLHRDVKCANIMIGSDGNVVLTDWGLARDVSQRIGRRRPELTLNVGSLWYLPPELLVECRRYGVGIDMWAVGVVILEMLTASAGPMAHDSASERDSDTDGGRAPRVAVDPRILPTYRFAMCGHTAREQAAITHVLLGPPPPSLDYRRILDGTVPPHASVPYGAAPADRFDPDANTVDLIRALLGHTGPEVTRGPPPRRDADASHQASIFGSSPPTAATHTATVQSGSHVRHSHAPSMQPLPRNAQHVEDVLRGRPWAALLHGDASSHASPTTARPEHAQSSHSEFAGLLESMVARAARRRCGCTCHTRRPRCADGPPPAKRAPTCSDAQPIGSDISPAVTRTTPATAALGTDAALRNHLVALGVAPLVADRISLGTLATICATVPSLLTLPNCAVCSCGALLRLLRGLLDYCPDSRLTADAAMSHPFFTYADTPVCVRVASSNTRAFLSRMVDLTCSPSSVPVMIPTLGASAVDANEAWFAPQTAPRLHCSPVTEAVPLLAGVRVEFCGASDVGRRMYPVCGGGRFVVHAVEDLLTTTVAAAREREKRAREHWRSTGPHTEESSPTTTTSRAGPVHYAEARAVAEGYVPLVERLRAYTATRNAFVSAAAGGVAMTPARVTQSHLPLGGTPRLIATTWGQ